MRLFLVCFGLILSFHLYAGYVDNDIWIVWSKPFIVGSLLVLVGHAVWKAGIQKFSVLVFLGLLLSLVGDVLLIFQSDDSKYFIAGLASFLLAHMAYTWAFSMTYLHSHTIPLIKRQGWVMILIIAYSFVLIKELRPSLGEMTIPVVFYTLAITTMLLIAVNRQGRVGTMSFWFIAIGAGLFVISDTALAWNKFKQPLEHAHLIIMSTYGLAQLGIALGAIFQLKDLSARKNGRAITKAS